jgi:hypothetical protein
MGDMAEKKQVRISNKWVNTFEYRSKLDYDPLITPPLRLGAIQPFII